MNGFRLAPVRGSARRGVPAGFTAALTLGLAVLLPAAPAGAHAVEAGSSATRAGAGATARLLGYGDWGSEVLSVQARLRQLGYWAGPPDGVFGPLTEQAVFAFQKVSGLTVDGIVGPATRAALATANRPVPRSGILSGIEVDRDLQVLKTVRGGQAVWVFNTSTGTGEPYSLDGVTEVAETPPGEWQVYRRFDGVESAPLGALYRPIYFHTDGIAIHGYPEVPVYPASHGCVRLTDAAMDFIWAGQFARSGATVHVL